MEPRWRSWKPTSDLHQHGTGSEVALASDIGPVGLLACWLDRKSQGDFTGRYSSNSEPEKLRRNPSSAKVSVFPAKPFVLLPAIVQMWWQRARGAAGTHGAPREGNLMSAWHQEEDQDQSQLLLLCLGTLASLSSFVPPKLISQQPPVTAIRLEGEDLGALLMSGWSSLPDE